MMYHNPVLLNESIEGLNLKPGAVVADLTFGGGGHSKAILEKIGEGRLIAFDNDIDAATNLPNDKRITFVNHNFRYLKNFLRFHNAIPVDAILADLGVSSYQFDKAEKGFSIRFDAPLDLRMNQSQPLTAANVINTYEQNELARILSAFGEIKGAGRVAAHIVAKRQQKTIARTSELVEVLKRFTNPNTINKFMAQVFQALRIEVNDELSALEEMLVQSLEVLAPGGRLVVISYHSLEDRLVKNFMKSGNVAGDVEKDFYGNTNSPFILISRKAIVPDEVELEGNKRSRSAKLRIAEKIAL
jgi:16S rRNA (cytosine1402-N4)-methyltransferase